MKTSKKIISLLMCMLMVLTMAPLSVFAEDTVDVTQMYIHNGTGEITALGQAALACDIDRISTDGWKWDSVNRQLLLSGFDGKYIEADGDLTIVLTGENTITMYDNGSDYESIYGIRSTGGNIVIKGDGKGGRDSLFVGQTAIENIYAYYTAIYPAGYNYDTYITDCDVKIEFAGADPSSDWEAKSHGAIDAYAHITGNANLDIDMSASKNNYTTGVNWLYAETSGTIDINIYDADKTDAHIPGELARCTGGLTATGTGTVNLNADGNGYANRYILHVGENAGTITAKGKLDLSGFTSGYITSGTYYKIPYNKAITSLDGTKQYCIGYNYNEELYILEDSNETVATEWKISTVENNPLVFFDIPSLDQEASYIKDGWDYEFLQGLVFGGSGEYTYTATGCPEGIYMDSYVSRGLKIARLAGDFKAACEAGTITVTVTDSLGATASIDISYGAITEEPKYVTVDGNKFNAKEDKSGTGWAYTAADKTLALNNYDGGPIISEDELTTIILTGNNTVTMPETAEDFKTVYGIDSGEGGMTIKGDGTGTRDTLTVTQTAIENIRAYYTAIESGEYNNHMYITDCDVKIELAGADSSSSWEARNREAINAYAHITGNANLDIDMSASKNSYTTGVNWLYAETSGTIDINIYDADKTDAHIPGELARCTGGLTATGTGTVNLNVDGNGYANRYILHVGENAGTITAKGKLDLSGATSGYITSGTYYKIPYNKAITSLDGTKQYCIGYNYNEELYILEDSNETVATEWKISTVENNPLVFLDMPSLDQAAGITGDSWDYEFLQGLVFGGNGEYTYTATGCPQGIYLDTYDRYGLTIARLAGDFETISEGGIITVTVTDSLGATASIDIAYGAIAPKTPVTGISLDKDEIIINVGEEYKLKPTISPEDVTVAAVTWGSDDDYIADVDDNGVVKGRDAGVATVTVTTVQGGFKDTCKVYVKEEKPEAQQDGEYIYDLDSNTEYRINGTAYTTDGNGRIPIDDSWLQAYVSIVKTNEEEKCYSDPQSLIIGGKKIRNEWITLEYYSTLYDGTEKCPGVTVKDGDTLLTLGNDYTLTYKDNTDAGDAYAVVTGIGGYTGVVEKNFYIDGNSIYNADVTLSPDTFDYDGNAKTPAVTVVIDETILVEGTDYTLEFYDNIKAGTASVKVSGKGSYAGSKLFYFTIKPCTHTWDSGVIVKNSTCAAEGEMLYTCTVKDCGETKTEVIEKKTEHTWNTGVHTTPPTCTEEGEITYTCKVAGCGATKTAVAPSNGHSWLDATCTAPKTCKNCGATEGAVGGHTWVAANCTTPKTCSTCGVTEGTENGHTWVDANCTTPKKCSVCGTTEGSANGHTWLDATCSAPKTCKICGATSGSVASHTYENVITKATLTTDGKIESKCSFCGDVESSQTITKIGSVTLSAEKYVHDGKNKTPKVTVKDADGNTLVKNVDYKTSVASNRSGIGKYTVKVTFIGNYEGSKNVYFTILPGKPATIKAASQTTTSVKLSWSEVSGAAGYTVYRYSPSKSAYVKAGTTEDTSFTVKSLYSATEYTFKVVAYGKTSGGKVYDSESYALLKSGTMPGKPSSVKSASQTTSSIKLSWSAVTRATGYNVYRYSPSKKAYVKAGSTTGTSYTVKSLYDGTKYTFRVVPYFKTSDGTIIESSSYALLKTATKTNTPTLSKVASSSKGKATLTWSAVDGETGYTVYYSTNKDSGFKKYDNFKADSKTGTVSGLTSGKTYYFKVRTYITTDSGYVYSAWSAVKSVKVK